MCQTYCESPTCYNRSGLQQPVQNPLSYNTNILWNSQSLGGKKL